MEAVNVSRTGRFRSLSGSLGAKTASQLLGIEWPFAAGTTSLERSPLPCSGSSSLKPCAKSSLSPARLDCSEDLLAERDAALHTRPLLPERERELSCEAEPILDFVEASPSMKSASKLPSAPSLSLWQSSEDMKNSSICIPGSMSSSASTSSSSSAGALIFGSVPLRSTGSAPSSKSSTEGGSTSSDRLKPGMQESSPRPARLRRCFFSFDERLFGCSSSIGCIQPPLSGVARAARGERSCCCGRGSARACCASCAFVGRSGLRGS
mmetsp:Transcript_73721/g.172999  ORF Transcript_73721/g.172999 Transcript_73721/m.172999 type:complete len:266 (-) Transcript_73721:382-1179(-)